MRAAAARLAGQIYGADDIRRERIERSPMRAIAPERRIERSRPMSSPRRSGQRCELPAIRAGTDMPARTHHRHGTPVSGWRDGSVWGGQRCASLCNCVVACATSAAFIPQKTSISRLRCPDRSHGTSEICLCFSIKQQLTIASGRGGVRTANRGGPTGVGTWNHTIAPTLSMATKGHPIRHAMSVRCPATTAFPAEGVTG